MYIYELMFHKFRKILTALKRQLFKENFQFYIFLISKQVLLFIRYCVLSSEATL